MSRLAASLALVGLVGWGCGRPKPILNPVGPWQRVLAKPTHHVAARLVDPSRTKAVSLAQILAYADEHAPAIALARSELAGARAEHIAASLRFPSDPVVSSWFGPRHGAGGTAVDVGVSLQQQLELGGQRGVRLKAAKRRRAFTLASIEQARRAVHQRVHAAFHAALLERERVVAAKKLLAFAERLVTIARKRLAAGDIARFHLQVAEGEVALAKQQLIAANAGYASARLTLAEESGWPAATPPTPSEHLDAPQATPPVQQLVALALAHHPALRTRAAGIKLAEANVAVADRSRLPNLTVGLSYAQEAEATAGGTARQHIGLVNLSIPLPLFRRNQAARTRSQAALIAAHARYSAVRRSVAIRVRRAAVAVNSGVAQIKAYGSDILPRFEANLDKLQRAFELGQIDVLQVLVARGRFLELQRDALAAYGAYYRAVARLEAEVGTEVWPDEHQPTNKRGEK